MTMRMCTTAAAMQFALISAVTTMTEHFRIAINSMALNGKIPAGDVRWATFNDSFQNLEIDRYDLLNAITEGHAYAAWHDGRRKLENFVCAQHIAVDMDTGDKRSDIAILSQSEFVRAYAALIHTTPSHRPNSQRARIIFLLDTCITSVDAYAAAAQFLISLFAGADEACKDASRFFYGCRDAEVWLSENVLPLTELRGLYRYWQKRHPHRRAAQSEQRTEYAPKDFADLAERLVEPVRTAPAGNRNNTLNRQAFLAGKDIAQRRLNESEIMAQLVWAAQTVGLSEIEAQRTVYSGIRSGKAAQ